MSGLPNTLGRALRSVLSLGTTSPVATAGRRLLPAVIADPDPALDGMRPLEIPLSKSGSGGATTTSSGGGGGGSAGGSIINGAGAGVVFDNPWAPGVTARTPSEMWRLMSRPQAPYPTPSQVALELPQADVDLAAIHAHRKGDPMRVTWIGHATVLVQMAGLNFITDPVFAQRCSAVQWAGPKRYTPPAIPLSDLPPLDFVLVSHSHYDHLCAESVAAIGNGPLWIVPRGLRGWFARVGVDHCVEMSWWDSVAPHTDALKVVCLPAQHWSSRTPWDRNTTLWCSYAAIATDDTTAPTATTTPSGTTAAAAAAAAAGGNGHGKASAAAAGTSSASGSGSGSGGERFYFAGDTSRITRADVHGAIGRRYGPFDIAAIPIGAYEPRWFMDAQHCDPDEALAIAADVRARRSVAIHWGTFNLAWDGYAQPPRDLVAAMRARAATAATTAGATTTSSGEGGEGGAAAQQKEGEAEAAAAAAAVPHFEILRHGESIIRGEPRSYACRWAAEADAATAKA